MLLGIWFLFLLCNLPTVLLQDLEGACLNVNCRPGSVCVQGGCLPLPPSEVAPTIINEADVCASNPCMNDCKCVPSCKHSNGYYCESPSGYLGKNCNIEKPALNCSSDRIILSVSSEFFVDAYPTQETGCLFVGEKVGERGNGTCSVCQATGNHYIISLPLPFNQCGGEMSSMSGTANFSNLIWAGLKEADMYDVPIPVLRFKCVYNQEYNILTSLKPSIENYRVAINDSMKFRSGIELCKIGTECPKACPTLYSVQPGAIYTISETIHTTMSIQSSYLTEGNNAVILETMHLSCSSSYTDAPSMADVLLVSGGCETSLLTTSINRRRSNERVVCASFKVPRLLECKDSVFYIHVKLRITEKTSAPICSGPSPRLKRSSGDEDPNKTASMTFPLRVINGSHGESSFEQIHSLHDEKVTPLPAQHATTNSNINKTQTTYRGLIIGAVVLGALLFLILIVSFAAYYCRG